MPANVSEWAIGGLIAATGEEVQTASLRFFLPVIVAYLTACAGWLLLDRLAIAPRRKGRFPETRRPWWELLVAVLAAVAIFALGRAYEAGWLLPAGTGARHQVSWTLNNIIIFSPIGLALAIRGHGLRTILVPTDHLGRRLLIGAGLGVLATAVYLALRGELEQFDDVLAGVVLPRNATNLLPVMLEGVGLAFLFVRFRWVVGPWPSLIAAGMLFAIAHVPRQLEGGLAAGEMAAFFVLNTFLPAAILATVVKGRDVIWLAVVHYIMDIAIRAFE